MRFTYGAVFVLYNPSSKEIEHIADLTTLFDKLYVYDNSEKEEHSYAFMSKNIKYISNRSNDGLSKAYNYILRLAQNDNVDWLSIYDQDSEITTSMVNTLKTYAEYCDFSRVASICPYIQYGETKPLCNKTREVNWTINSGQMINVKTIVGCGIEYDENLFLDRVDRDFCMQLEKKHLKIIQVENAIMKQNLGELYIGVSIHSPLRNYYMCKNRLYYNRKYYGFIKATLLSVFQTIKHFINVIKIGKDVQRNLNMMCRGIKDYSLKKMGKID